MPNQLKRDPTRTTLLRRQFMADMRRRFAKIRRAVKKLMLEDDVFGLKIEKPLRLLEAYQAWRFKSDSAKVTSFHRWLQQQVDAELLGTDVAGRPWAATYIDSAYKRGMMRGYTDAHATELAQKPAFYEESKTQFLRDAFTQGEALSKVELLYTRTFEELRGVTAAMGQQMSRVLANGLAHGIGPREIARSLDETITSITRTRALVIARTEIVAAHAEGQLDSFERLGIAEVQGVAEWSTAGDDRVCELCAPLEGTTYTLEEARGLIPLHPNCLHPDSLVSPSGEVVGVSRRWFDGDMFVITTSLGDKFTCTPNHPIATNLGFVSVSMLDIGSKVISNSISERERICNGDDINKPARIEEIADAFFNNPSFTTMPVPVSPEDFHGDGEGSKIAIVGTNCFLGYGFNTFFNKHFPKSYFMFRNIGRILLNSFSTFVFSLPRNSLSPSCSMCGRDLHSSFISTHFRPFKFLGFTSGSNNSINRNKSVSYTTSIYTKFFRKLIDRHPIFIKLFDFVNRQRDKKLFGNLLLDVGTTFMFDDVTHIESFHYSGYVYNLETTKSYYIANNIASHNCRCAWIPVSRGR